MLGTSAPVAPGLTLRAARISPLTRVCTGLFSIGTSLALVLFSVLPQALADDKPASGVVDDEYRAIVRSLLEATGSLELGLQMADGVVDSMLATMRATNQPVEPRAETIIRETARELFGTVFGDEQELVRVQATIYGKHFSKSELRELLAFYKTPIGTKTIEVMPAILSEGMAYGQLKAQENMQKFQRTLVERLQAEGLLDAEAE